jgi:hypothetical protein
MGDVQGSVAWLPGLALPITGWLASMPRGIHIEAKLTIGLRASGQSGPFTIACFALVTTAIVPSGSDGRARLFATVILWPLVANQSLYHETDAGALGAVSGGSARRP